MHWPPHDCWPAGQPQTPPEQPWPAGHTVPQVPQLVALVWVSVQLLPQVIVPAGQVAAQARLLQNRFCAAQLLPQLPQLAPSDEVSTHAPEHASSPGEHMHVPPMQAVCAGHEEPQLPQLFTSELVSTQPLPQSSDAPGHVEHDPLLHAAPPGQALLQLPQLSTLLLR
jgi:hypothetical protein